MGCTTQAIGSTQYAVCNIAPDGSYDRDEAWGTAREATTVSEFVVGGQLLLLSGYVGVEEYSRSSPEKKTLYGVRLGLVNWYQDQELVGSEVGIANYPVAAVTGLQIAILGNSTSGDFKGFQLAGLGNAIGGKGSGFQLSVLHNWVRDGDHLFQAAALANGCDTFHRSMSIGAFNDSIPGLIVGIECMYDDKTHVYPEMEKSNGNDFFDSVPY